MFRKNFLILTSLVLILLTGCQKQTPIPTPDLSFGGSSGSDTNWADNYKGEIEWVECPFSTNQTEPRCGYLSVPTDYTLPDYGDGLRLAFAIYKSSNSSPQPDPLVLSSINANTGRSRFITFRFEEILNERDVIVFDMRGTGLSEPQLNCPDISEQAQEAAPTGGLTAEQWKTAHEQCRQTWAAESIDLDAYTIENLANDLKALRLALGYPQWNIFASDEIGATVAYEQSRIDPEGVRSLVLDGALPIMADQTQGYDDAQRVLQEFFELCTQDAKCGQTFPELRTTFYKAVGQLNTQPINVEVTNLSSGTRTNMQVDGDTLVSLVLSLIGGGQENNLGLIPRMIYQIIDNNPETLAQLLGNPFNDFGNIGEGLDTLLYCRQSPPDEEKANAGIASLEPELAHYFQEQVQINLSICEAWEPLPGASKSTAASSKPILLLQGGWNWTWAPESNVELFKHIAPDTQVVVLPMAGRFNLFSRNSLDCTRAMLTDFIENPNDQVDSQCVRSNLQITWITLQ